jgi:hypothetical protein
MALIRNSFPKARIRVRLDGGFANPELLEFLDGEPGVEYVVAMASNAVLQRKAEEDMQVARLLASLTDRTEHVYGETSYAAGTWKRERFLKLGARVVVSMRRVVVHLPQSFPFLAAFRQIAMVLGASPG